MLRIALIVFSLIIFFSGFFISNTISSEKSSIELADSIKNRSFVVLELFTSLSCSSCPEADAHIGRVQELATKSNLPIYPIAFHVDYWNHLDWVDKYSSPKYSERQEQYSRIFKKLNIYTPQMVVNGQYEFVGSNASVCEDQINSILKEEPDQFYNIEATFEQVNDSIIVFYSLNKKNKGFVNIALLENASKVEIKSGENKGRVIKCYNVVRQFTQIKSNDKSGKVILKCPEDLDPANYSIIVYMQNTIDMRIKGAAWASLM